MIKFLELFGIGFVYEQFKCILMNLSNQFNSHVQIPLLEHIRMVVRLLHPVGIVEQLSNMQTERLLLTRLEVSLISPLECLRASFQGRLYIPAKKVLDIQAILKYNLL